MNSEEAIAKLDTLVGSWAMRVRNKEAVISAIRDSDRKSFLLGYIVATLRAKWELEDVLDKIEPEEE